MAISAWVFSGLSAQTPSVSNNDVASKFQLEKQVKVCHFSGSEYHTLSISYSALAAHLAHGDVLGECPDDASSPLTLSYTRSDVKCNGGNDGAIDLTVQVSVKHAKKYTLEFLWSTGAVTEDIAGLTTGEYAVTVSLIRTKGNDKGEEEEEGDNDNGGKDGCKDNKKSNGWNGKDKNISQTIKITISEPSALEMTLKAQNITCFGLDDGKIIAIPTGGVSPYTVAWSDNAAGQSGNMAINLSKGTYQGIVSDANGCGFTSEIAIDEPAALISTTSSGNVLCNGGSDGFAAVTGQGGIPPYSYQWSANTGGQTSESVSSLSKDSYSYTVTDVNGCQATAEVIIDEPALLTVTIGAVNQSCNGNDGKALAAVVGGVPPYSFAWDGGTGFQSTAEATNLAQGIYSVTISDANGCTVVSAVNVEKDVCSCMLRTEDCGATMVSLAQFIYCNPMPGATNYQWEFSHPQSGFLKTIQRGFGLNNFHLTWVPGIQYGKTYSVRIKPFVNGVWMDYGPACEITVPSPVPYTKVRVQDCGLSSTSLNQQLFCDAVAGAQNYQWEFSNTEMGFLKVINRGNSSLNFLLGWVPGIQYGKTYEVRVRASVGGEWGDFGEICQVSLVYPIPVTKVRTSDCGITLTALAQNIFCDAVAGATDYQWEISNADLNFLAVFNRNSTSTNFQFAWVPGVQPETTYSVRVRGKAAGEWAEFGLVCQITTPKAAGTARMGNVEEETENVSLPLLQHALSLNVYPNPSDGGAIRIGLSGTEMSREAMLIEVFDMLGNKVMSKNTANAGMQTEINSNNELASGVYIVNVTANGSNYIERIVIK